MYLFQRNGSDVHRGRHLSGRAGGVLHRGRRLAAFHLRSTHVRPFFLLVSVFLSIIYSIAQWTNLEVHRDN